jgi:hypothetical protein
MIKVGRLQVNEAVLRAFEENWSDDGRTVSLSGILFSTDPGRSRYRLGMMHDDVLGLPDSLVPLVFDVKSHRNGYYRVAGSKSSLVEIDDQQLIQLTWGVDLVKAGNDDEIDLESRLAGPVNRLNDHSLSGERWHAPAQAHYGYWAGTASPGTVTRTGADGAVKVYRDVPFDANPRWACPVESYYLGRVRLTDEQERCGLGVTLGPQWMLSNGLLSIYPSSVSGFQFQFHNGTSWSAEKRIAFTAAGSNLGPPNAVSVLHNDYDRVTVRCLWNRSPVGRIHGDLTLRRGSRFLEAVIKSNSALTLGVTRAVNEAATAGTGFIRATSNDGNGNRYVLGSLKSFTSDLTAGGISKASVTRFDCIVGAEIAGSSAVAGDQAANLMAQYVGTPSEVVQAVRR